MAKIFYTDEEGKEVEINDKFSLSRLFIIITIVSFLVGAMGGIGGVFFWQKYSPTKSKEIGIKELEKPEKKEIIKVEESSDVIEVVKKVAPTVVSITTITSIQDFFGNIIQQKGGGTGFIITNDGLILTNRHVVEQKQATYTIFTADGRKFTPKIVSLDPFIDLALLKIDATGLPVVELGDSDSLQIGQRVIAIGNALGELQNTVSLGIISGRGREVTATGSGKAERLENLLQTDAAINLGNSGGPLVDLKGRVVGINVAVAGGAENIGFAIPINGAKSAIDSIKRTGKITRPLIGIRYIPITKEVAQSAGLPVDYGVIVLRGDRPGELAVIPGSPADQAGIKENDIITYFNDIRIDQNQTLASLMLKSSPGEEVSLKILRASKEFTLKLKLGEMKE